MLLLCPAIPAIFPPLRKKLLHILPAGSLSDYLTALGLAWQPAKGGWGRRGDEIGRRREELARDEVLGSTHVCARARTSAWISCVLCARERDFWISSVWACRGISRFFFFFSFSSQRRVWVLRAVSASVKFQRWVKSACGDCCKGENERVEGEGEVNDVFRRVVLI